MASSWRDTITDIPEATEPGMLESAGRGAAQSLSFGLADEATGAGEAGLDILQDPAQLSAFLELYKKHRDESRANNELAQKTNPWSYFGGEIGGGLVPGLGVGSAVAKTAGAGAKMLAAAKTGAKGGALYGFGGSNEEDAVEIAKDTLAGGAAGGAIMGAGTGLFQGVKGTSKYVGERSQFLQDVKESFKRGAAGEELAGKIGLENTEKSVNAAGEELMDLLKGEIKRGSNIKDEAEKIAEKNGLTVDIEELLKKYEAAIANTNVRGPNPKKEKAELLDLIKEELHGPEVEKVVDIGEKAAIEALTKKQSVMNTKASMGEPEAVAEAKLMDKFSQKELTSKKAPTNIYESPSDAVSTAGVEALATTGPNGQKMAQLIKGMKPGEIQIIDDPTTGKKVAAFMDEATGKVHTQPITEQMQTVIERSGGKTKFSPSELTDFISDIKELAPLGDKGIQSKKVSAIVMGLTKDLQGLQRGEAFGTVGAQFQDADKIMHSALKARDLLFPAMIGITDVEKAKISAKLADTIANLGKSGNTGRKTRNIVEKALEFMEETNPDLVKNVKDKMLDRATAHDLASRMNAESTIQGSLIGTVQGKVLSGSNFAGGYVKKLSETAPGKFAGNIKSFISGSTPETLQATRNALAGKQGNAVKDLDMKLEAAQNAKSPQSRNAILFAVMQTPAYRELIGINNDE